MTVLVIDGQGGGLGRQLVAAVKARVPGAAVWAVGTNSAATTAMLRAGADKAATGENAVAVACRRADVIVGPVGIVIADAMLGEITPAMALAVGQSAAARVLVPVNQCDNIVAGAQGLPGAERRRGCGKPGRRRPRRRGTVRGALKCPRRRPKPPSPLLPRTTMQSTTGCQEGVRFPAGKRALFYTWRKGATMTLQDFFAAAPKAAVAFSGGTDSAFVLWAARQYGCQVRAYYARSVFQPAFEWEDARRLAQSLGVELTVVPVDILAVAGAAANGPRRCYHCKQALFTALRGAAAADGYPLLLDGTNASDDAGERPGMQALRELAVRSPLRECGLTKAEVRERSRQAGLFTWNKPAYACLATRVPTGTPLTADTLRRVEQAEAALTALGFADFRVRVLGQAARIQLTEPQLAAALDRRGEILDALRPLFSAVLLDLDARPASL